MKITMITTVNQSYIHVWQGFTQTLFEALASPFPKMKVIQFDGCYTGDKVIVELDFMLFKQKWYSHIIEQQHTDREIYFIDEGRTLPFFLKDWKHTHRLMKYYENQCQIVDEISYHTPFRWLDFILYPVFYLQFLYRKPIYRKYFS
jgi:ligand-binding SRPBCC domain-containing protein